MKNECLSLDLSVDLSRHVYKLEGKVLVTNFFVKLLKYLFPEQLTAKVNHKKMTKTNSQPSQKSHYAM